MQGSLSKENNKGLDVYLSLSLNSLDTGEWVFEMDTESNGQTK